MQEDILGIFRLREIFVFIWNAPQSVLTCAPLPVGNDHLRTLLAEILI